jgi:hypothetical protein
MVKLLLAGGERRVKSSMVPPVDGPLGRNGTLGAGADRLAFGERPKAVARKTAIGSADR